MQKMHLNHNKPRTQAFSPQHLSLSGTFPKDSK